MYIRHYIFLSNNGEENEIFSIEINIVNNVHACVYFINESSTSKHHQIYPFE